jgi:two-component system, cell cycle sensor histidine kinase and response regulator CckA
MLGRLGYQVSSRTDSQEALELFRAAPEAFDLVITDQTMPRMSGAELARRMLVLRPDLPIIICSGYSETFSPETARELGIRKFLMKPVLLGEIATTIRKVLDDNG